LSAVPLFSRGTARGLVLREFESYWHTKLSFRIYNFYAAIQSIDQSESFVNIHQSEVYLYFYATTEIAFQRLNYIL
jgi:hypothetical protein